MKLPKFLRDLRYAIFYRLVLDKSMPLISLGNAATGCSWAIHPDVLDAGSIIYSGGVGNDITFEHALVKRFGCRVVLCDPSPTGVATMAKPDNQIPQFAYERVGLAAAPGVLRLCSPVNAEEGSWYLQTGQSGEIQVPCSDLSTLMAAHGHQRIDLLKLDIEGSEYGVLDDLAARAIPVRQICVEFHHGIIPGVRRSQAIRAIVMLRRRGYRLLCQEGNNHTFLWRGPWPPPSATAMHSS